MKLLSTQLVLALMATALSPALSADFPRLISDFANVEHNFHKLNPDAEFTLKCAARGMPEPRIVWFKDEKMQVDILQIQCVMGRPEWRNNRINFSDTFFEKRHVSVCVDICKQCQTKDRTTFR
jgi:hypothetical protein